MQCCGGSCSCAANLLLSIDKYIDRFFATPQEDGSLRLEIKIFTGEATEKYLNRLKQRAAEQEKAPEYAAVGAGRTGHTFKKILPAQSAKFEWHNRISPGHVQTVEYKAVFSQNCRR